MKAQWTLFLLAVQFLTRLPVPADLPFSEELQARAARYFPAAGLVVGGLGAAVLALGAQLWALPVAVLLSLAATLIATGALHEDGLADAADGLVGGADRDRALEIMRDSRIGSYGVLALGVALAIKVAVLAALPIGVACAALIGGHVLGRAAAVQVIALDRYARAEGAKFAPPRVARHDRLVAAGTTVFILIALLPWLGAGLAAALVGAALLGSVFRRLFLRKLGGYTGDCLGAMQQLVELGFYLGLAAWA
jgi:adenosylcobinamide-GDP ribazoletransferase